MISLYFVVFSRKIQSLFRHGFLLVPTIVFTMAIAENTQWLLCVHSAIFVQSLHNCIGDRYKCNTIVSWSPPPCVTMPTAASDGADRHVWRSRPLHTMEPTTESSGADHKTRWSRPRKIVERSTKFFAQKTWQGGVWCSIFAVRDNDNGNKECHPEGCSECC